MNSLIGFRPSRTQDAALRCLRANYGEASEGTVWMEGLSNPRHTLRSLERRGLVVRGEYLNEDDGYLWRLTDAA